MMEGRAIIKRLQHIKNNIIKPELKALKNALNVLNQSSKCNPKSQEMRILRKQIKVKENDLATVKAEIAMEKQYLSDYIKNKEIIYNKIRQANS